MLEHWRVKLRKFKWDDLYAVQALINMIAEDENDPYFYNLEWLHFHLNQQAVNAEQNCFVSTVYGGKIVGYSRIEIGDDPTRITVHAGTHPNMQGIGIGRSLVRLNDFNLLAISPHDKPLIVVRHTATDHQPSADLLACAGYDQTDVNEDNHLMWEKQLR